MSQPRASRAAGVLEVKAPAFSESDAERVAEEVFGIGAEAHALYSERDQNFRLRARNGRELVLKIANPAEDPVVVDFHTQALLHIASVDESLPVPHVLRSADGAPYCWVEGPDGRRSLTRLLTYLPGRLLDDAPHSAALLRDVGAITARLARALRGFFHPGARHELLWDLLQAPRLLEHTRHIEDAAERRLVERTLERFEARVLPQLRGMRAQVIHNDVSLQNTIVDLDAGNRVVGVIDFGDMIHAPLVNDIAVPVSELTVGKGDPLAVAMEIVAGYHEVEPFREEELRIAIDLAATRMAMNLAVAQWRVKHHPENSAYISAGNSGVAEALEWLVSRAPEFTRACLRHACGLPGVPTAPAIRHWLRENADACGGIFARDLGAARKRVLDARDLAAHTLEECLAGADVGIVAHDSELPCGGREALRSPRVSDERCSVHLGIDLYTPAGTEVRAPLGGSIHSVPDAAVPDAVVVLEHPIEPGLRFYSLYRGLDTASLAGLRAGKPIRSGALLGHVAARNGVLPQLHVQIASELLDGTTPPPPHCEPSKRAVWADLSPDANLLLQIPREAFAARGDESAALRARRDALLGPALDLFYDRPVHAVRARGCRMIDASGRVYLDAYNNVPQVGHCHPAVVEALARQAATLNTNTRYLYESVLEYAERLTATLPEGLSVCSFVNSGSEANDLAWRLAKAHTGHAGGIVIREAYHGTTDAVYALSPYEIGDPARIAPHVVTVPAPDDYRGPHRRGSPRLAECYAAYLDEAIAMLRQRGHEPAAFYIDLGLSSSGIVVPPEGYLSAAFEKVRAAGGLCVADEVQSGFGRSGTHMWGFEAHGGLPDIVTLGKPIGNGHPLAAVLTRPEILRSLTDHYDFFSTFGGNPVACAVGLAVLDVLEREGLRENARRVGAYLRAGLEELAARSACIGDVRGVGLFIGVDIVRDRETREPDGKTAHELINRMREDGVLVGIDGPHHNVLKIRPPLVFREADADRLVESLGRALTA
ncbi:MAG: aminotransferase class III-fold pyridoxal phosphate-dependent enzyme [Myxococcales bacterium]|nr:aminotransferase class III-fold pyridoxal phosphate-dependent enzyme [Myxococcales bacterium]